MEWQLRDLKVLDGLAADSAEMRWTGQHCFVEKIKTFLRKIGCLAIGLFRRFSHHVYFMTIIQTNRISAFLNLRIH